MEYNNFWTTFLTHKKHYFLIFIRTLKCEAQTEILSQRPCTSPDLQYHTPPGLK